MNKKERELVTTREIVGMFEERGFPTSVISVNSWRKKGKFIESIEIGGRNFYRMKDVREYLDSKFGKMESESRQPHCEETNEGEDTSKPRWEEVAPIDLDTSASPDKVTFEVKEEKLGY